MFIKINEQFINVNHIIRYSINCVYDKITETKMGSEGTYCSYIFNKAIICYQLTEGIELVRQIDIVEYEVECYVDTLKGEKESPKFKAALNEIKDNVKRILDKEMRECF